MSCVVIIMLKRVLPKYKSKFSKKTFTQPQLFAVLSYKIYNNMKYRENSESLELSSTLTKALGLKKGSSFYYCSEILW